eukprot:2744580-Amphidinium_carterae.1
MTRRCTMLEDECRETPEASSSRLLGRVEVSLWEGLLHWHIAGQVQLLNIVVDVCFLVGT